MRCDVVRIISPDDGLTPRGVSTLLRSNLITSLYELRESHRAGEGEAALERFFERYDFGESFSASAIDGWTKDAAIGGAAGGSPVFEWRCPGGPTCRGNRVPQLVAVHPPLDHEALARQDGSHAATPPVSTPRDRSWVCLYKVAERAHAVRVVFSDETGTGSLKKEPVLVIAALMMNVDSQWGVVQRDVSSARRKAEADVGAGELKGRKLLKALRHDPQSPAGDVLKAITESLVRHGVPVFYEAVNRHGFAEFEQNQVEALRSLFPDIPTDPYSHAASSCIGQVFQYLRAEAPREKAIWIADRSGHFERLTKMAVKWNTLTSAFASGLRDSLFSTLVDTIYFGDSHESLALQLADVCCTLIAGHLRGDAVAEPYYRILRRAIVAERPIQFAEGS